MNVKDMVKNHQRVDFVRYEAGELWYKTECGFEFPVPIADAGSGAFVANDKAILFMRWIKPHLERHLNNLEAAAAAKAAALDLV